MNTLRFPWRTRRILTPHPIHVQAKNGLGTVIGEAYGMTDGGVTYLTDMAVDESVRGFGYGRLLMEKFIERAGNTTIILMTDGAEGFYAKFGFIERIAMIRRPMPCAE